MGRRRALIPIAALVIMLLSTGCVEQPFDESQLQATDGAPGVAASRLDARQARRAAQKARRAETTKPQKARKAGGQRDGGADAGADTGPAADDARGDRSDEAEPVMRGDDSGTTRQRSGNDEGGAAPSRQPPPFRVVGKIADDQDDPSGSSPAYADVRQLLLESNGTAARVTVAVAGGLPRALADGEVEGIGIDFYRSDARESDFQLFVTGNSGGWEAFLHTPQGVMAYPGRFAIGGRVLVFQLPWSALGGPRPADVGMFVDWSQERTVLNAVGNDRAPDDGRIAVRP